MRKQQIEAKPHGSVLELQVSSDLTVQVIPNPDHEFLMDTKTVANGYGITIRGVNDHKKSAELIEGKHFVTAGSITSNEKSEPHNKIYWTKRGIIRLGFFIKSERAKLFRDWAEDLVLSKLSKPMQQVLFDEPKALETPKRRRSRVNANVMLSILQDVCLIKDNDLRIRLTNKITSL